VFNNAYTLTNNAIAAVNATVIGINVSTGPVGGIWQLSGGFYGYSGGQATMMGQPIYAYRGTYTGSIPSGTAVTLGVGTGTASGTIGIYVTGQPTATYNWLADISVIERG